MSASVNPPGAWTATGIQRDEECNEPEPDLALTDLTPQDRAFPGSNRQGPADERHPEDVDHPKSVLPADDGVHVPSRKWP